MSYEVEIKFRSAIHADLARRLKAMGGKAGRVREQEDVYLSHPARDFATSGEALRLRREGDSNRLTYKGPRQAAGPTKTREEIEIGFTAGAAAQADLRRVWEALGFQPVAVLTKRRTPFHLVYHDRTMEIVLDMAEGLGPFAEVESIAADAADLPAAQAAVLNLARELGLTDVEPRSYLRMALELRETEATKPEGD